MEKDLEVDPTKRYSYFTQKSSIVNNTLFRKGRNIFHSEKVTNADYYHVDVQKVFPLKTNKLDFGQMLIPS